MLNLDLPASHEPAANWHKRSYRN